MISFGVRLLGGIERKVASLWHCLFSALDSHKHTGSAELSPCSTESSPDWARGQVGALGPRTLVLGHSCQLVFASRQVGHCGPYLGGTTSSRTEYSS